MISRKEILEKYHIAQLAVKRCGDEHARGFHLGYMRALLEVLDHDLAPDPDASQDSKWIIAGDLFERQDFEISD